MSSIQQPHSKLLDTVSNPVWSCTSKKCVICWPSSWRVSKSKNKYSCLHLHHPLLLHCLSSLLRGACVFCFSYIPLAILRLHLQSVSCNTGVYWDQHTLHSSNTWLLHTCDHRDFFSCEPWLFCMSYIYNTVDKQTDLFCRVVCGCYSNHLQRTFHGNVCTLSILLSQ